MKIFIFVILAVASLSIGIFTFGLLRSKDNATASSAPVQKTLPSNVQSNEQQDMAVIRSFMANPNLELSFINTDLPTLYFSVGKITKVGNGENMEAVKDWTRQVNVYDQK